MTPVSDILKKLFIFFDKAGVDPIAGSPADNEIRSFLRPESMRTAFSIGIAAFIAASDYFEALETLVNMEKYAVAPWSCARGILESSAITTWLLDLQVDSKERVSRSLSLRYTVLREQEKLARFDGDDKKIQEIQHKIESIEGMAVNLGFKALRNKNNRRSGIGQVKPSITALVERQFSGERLYRILSGVAHSNYTSLMNLSFVKTNHNHVKGAVLIRAVPVEFQSMLVSHAATIYAKCVWLRTIQFGFNAADAAVLLEELYDRLEIADTNKDRFWRLLVGNNS